MANPLLLLTTRPWARSSLRRRRVAIPTELPTTDAVFLVMRRLRTPLITLIVTFGVAVLGLTLIPGVDEAGRPYTMTFFDAFYFMSYTAATIGFSEYPHTFTIAQRMWVLVFIYASVVTWAYCLGSLFTMFQEPMFRRAVTLQRFRRRVARLRDPFFLLVGYGEAGRTLSRALDGIGRRLVVLDEDPNRIDVLIGDALSFDVPNFSGDPRDPSLLGFAGLGHPLCEGVLAMTDKDEMNLAVIMASRLLRPDLPVISRCSQRANMGRMHDFEPLAVINPFERYGDYLALELKRPNLSRLTNWLMAPPGARLPRRRPSPREGDWIVVADDAFGNELAADLHAADLRVRVITPAAGNPDLSRAAGVVAGCESDAMNLAVAAHARLENPGAFLSIRQRSSRMTALVDAFSPDAVFVATDVVAAETLARLEAPLFWGFIEQLRDLDEDAAGALLQRMIRVLGNESPTAGRVRIVKEEAPAVVSWLTRGNKLTVGQLLTGPDGAGHPIAVVPTVLVRGDQSRWLPAEDEPLHPGDQLGYLVGAGGASSLYHTLFQDSTVEYLATGVSVPETWLWRRLGRTRHSPTARD